MMRSYSNKLNGVVRQVTQQRRGAADRGKRGEAAGAIAQGVTRESCRVEHRRICASAPSGMVVAGHQAKAGATS
jgi:hypothetical protein